MLPRLRVMLRLIIVTARIAWEPQKNVAWFADCQTSAAQGDEEDDRGDRFFGDFVR